ncbi:hypothetical protein [Stenotrophomonas rhizophila]|nr:hypothetical protein [Stenotrophomonas rhizophila]
MTIALVSIVALGMLAATGGLLAWALSAICSFIAALLKPSG